MFTQRAALLGFVAFCFYLIAVVNSLSGFYYALTWLSMAMLAASLGVALLSLVGLSCRLEVTRSRGAAPLGAVEESGALVALSVANAGTLNKTNIVLELRVLDAKNQSQSLRFLVEALPSGAAIDSVLPLSRLRRGRYRLQAARLVGSDVLGLFRMQKMVAMEGETTPELIIGPPVLRGGVSLEGGSNGFLSGRQRALLARQGDELRGTRPYAPGDDLRHVHWKSSARAGELVVKEWEQTGQNSALVIWDGAAESNWGLGDFDSGEWGLILCASLCHALLAGGTPCDFARVDEAPVLVESRALAGGQLPMALTDALSGAECNRTRSLEAALMSLPRLGARLSLRPIIVSSSLGSDLVRAALSLRSRGAQVQVLLIDAASLGTRAGDRRFRARGNARPAPRAVFQREIDGDGRKNQAFIAGAGDGNGNGVEVSRASFERQIVRLREIGANVIAVGAVEGESAETTLRAALRQAAPRPGLSANGG